jgi:hypothetical protein
MAGSNNLLQWNPNKVNQEDDTAYLADSQRSGGAPNGQIFPSLTANKLFYQLSTFVRAMGEMLKAKGYTISDASISTLITVLSDIVTKPELPIVQTSDFSGLAIKVTSTTQLTILANFINLWNSTLGLSLRQSGVNLTINTGVSGAGGLDTGSLAANTWYAVWALYNPTTSTLTGVISLSATYPTLSGYTYGVRLGWVRTDANKYLIPIIQYGRTVQYVNSGSGLPVMASGAAGNLTTPTWVAVPVGNFVPPTAFQIALELYELNNWGIAVVPNNNYGGTDSTTNPPLCLLVPASNYAATYEGMLVKMILESTNIYWANGGAASYLYASGWEDNL